MSQENLTANSVLADIFDAVGLFFNSIKEGIKEFVFFVHDISKEFRNAVLKIRQKIQATTIAISQFVDDNKEEINQCLGWIKNPHFQQEWSDLCLVSYAEFAFKEGDLNSVDEVLHSLYVDRRFIGRTLAKKCIDINLLETECLGLTYQLRLALFEVLKSCRYSWGFTKTYSKRIRSYISEKTRNKAIELAVEEFCIEYPHMENTIKRRQMELLYDSEKLDLLTYSDDVERKLEDRMQAQFYRESISSMIDAGDLSEKQSQFALAAVSGIAEEPKDVIRGQNTLNHSHWQSLLRKVKRRFG